ncbi:GNAT family N-acetyltransferase [Mucilaginibacter auburnensis]|uniref:Acetyltransferase (GNAT) family protein n=1 Tax=Mucilaginibacter auburnensis TaxID=1457233 RepID=A0A2H9VPV9_9SPHI|nr:GNAT family N-acetyltransferase [Mucilaginibacter auburnensis]PJJ80361.1 acetyltransferase (GNAT) family protein [Mucilaginibacter auburnensis]
MLYIEQIRPELTWRLRRDVLYPQEPLFKMEMDEDNNGYHFGAFQDNKLLAVVSLFWEGNDFQFRKFAVSPEAQSKGIGKALLEHITNFAINENGHRIWCNARVTATGFYAKYGFRQTGKTFSRGGFDYEIMEKMLTDK